MGNNNGITGNDKEYFGLHTTSFAGVFHTLEKQHWKNQLCVNQSTLFCLGHSLLLSQICTNYVSNYVQIPKYIIKNQDIYLYIY